MALEFLHANHIGSVEGFEPQRQNNGLIYFTDPTGQLTRDDIRLAIASFPLPKRTMGIVEVGYLNEKRKFAGLPTYDDLSIVFNDYVDRQTAQILTAWNYRVHDPVTGRTGMKADYALSGWMEQYSPNGVITRRWDFIGAWPSSFDPGDMDMEGEDKVRINMTLTIDKAIMAEPFVTVG